MKMNILCIIPAFNEQGNLPKLTKRLTAAFRKHKLRCAIFFVLQGDKNSVEIIKQLRRKYPNCAIEYVWKPSALGIGAAYRLGFSRVPKTVSHILTLDADLNHDPEDIPKFISAVRKQHADFVVGSRFIEHGAFYDRRGWKRVVSRWVNRIIMFLLHLRVHDLTSGYRLIRREVIEHVAPGLKEQGYPAYMELALTAHRAGFRLIEVPIVYSPRTWGESKMRTRDTLTAYLLFMKRLITSGFNSNTKHIRQIQISKVKGQKYK